ncbi:MAG: alpha/beta hydrolase, partial [bacterium]|nr:alpha/beta hydrolase [bacterium]
DMTVNFAGVTDKIIRRYFKDLETYYSNQPAREAIRSRLSAVLNKYKHKDIMLIAHSMGSIIAYDVLIQNQPGMKVHTFVTIGSPLGLPVVVSRIFSEQLKEKGGVTKLKTPGNVLNYWYNLSDLEDRVALDHTLFDDYGANSRQVRAEDMDVYNNYEMNGVRNPHKAYGYLRAPELSGKIAAF